MNPVRIWRPIVGSVLVTLGFNPASAADFSIQQIRFDAASGLELQFPAEPDSYFRLLRGNSISSITTPVAISLSPPLAVPTASDAAFFRVQKIPRSAPLDTDGDGRSDLEELLAGSNPLVPDSVLLGVTQFISSPATGDDGVAVTRETVLRFNRPLAPDAAPGRNAFFADAAGRRVLSRTEISPDRLSATLFYLEPLPSAARVRVIFDGDKVLDAAGKPVDADADGEPGGVGVVEFTTLNNLPVPNTAVLGRVFASELVPGSDTGTNALNRPLAGVIITVDGQEETLRAVTDAQGNFRLEPAPSGRFFVQVDGRTATGSQWPNGDYYPFVGKAWEAVPGKTNNLAGGTGEVYIPLIKAGSLQPVSQTTPTSIQFVPEVLAANPALAGVEIIVPAGALFDDNGTRGGRVGIAPVPPDRLPEPLPNGLNFPLVITIQTDGPRNFAVPVPVRFPNLPDPVSGVKLPPGAKTALWSFDHDKGYWEIVGPATVTDDGNFVETDPGVGVLQPGWHGVQPGATQRGGRLSRGCDGTEEAIMGSISMADLGGGWRQLSVTRGQHPGTVQWFSSEASPQRLEGDSVILKFCRPGIHLVRAVLAPDCYEPTTRTSIITIREDETCELRPLAVAGGELTAGMKVTFGPFQHTPGTIEWIAPGGTPETGVGETFTTVFCEPGTVSLTRKLRTECGRTCEVTDTFEVIDRTVGQQRGCFTEAPVPFELGVYEVASTVLLTAPPHVSGTVTWTVLDAFTGQLDDGPNRGEGDAFSITFTRAGEKRIIMTFTSDCGDVCEVELLRQVTEAPPGSGPSSIAAHGFPHPTSNSPSSLHIPGVEPVAQPVTSPPMTSPRRTARTHDDHGSPPQQQSSTGLHYFRLENLDNSRVLRGRTGSDGVAFPQPLILINSTRHRLTIITADGRFAADLVFTSAPMGQSAELPPLLLRPLTGPDADADGLPDLAEDVLGSNPNHRDSDGDGISDLAEAIAGTAIVGEDVLPLGALAVFPTGGYAWDVALEQDRVLVAAGSAGLAVFNVLNGQRPILIGRAETPAPALAVAARGNMAAVALGSGGLALIDLGTAPILNARIIPLNGPVNAVAFDELGVVTATPLPGGRSRVHLIDPVTGQSIAHRDMDRTVEDIAVAGPLIYILAAQERNGAIEVFQAKDGDLRWLQGQDLSVRKGAGGRRLRVIPAGDRIYTMNTDGFHFFRRRADGQIEGSPTDVPSDQDGWRHFGVTAGGILVAAADPAPVGGTHDIQIHRLQPPPLPPVVEFQIPTAGSAEAVVIRDGLAYVADGDAGLQVLRFQDADRAGRAPTVSLSSSTSGNTAQENQRVTVTALAVDDVEVARVEFLVDGELVATDASFPFEHTVVMPPLAEGRDRIRFQARAIDTGGNVGVSGELVLTLEEDLEPLWVNTTWPGDRWELDDNGPHVQTLTIWFTEPFNPASFRPELFRFFEAGPDGQLRTADDVEIIGAIPELRPSEGILRFHLPAPLPQGSYRAILAEGMADRKGNLMNYDHEWRFGVVGPWVVTQRPRSFGAWAGHSVRLWFNRPMDPDSLARAITAEYFGSGGVRDPVPFTLNVEADGTEAVLRFDPPLDPRPDPGSIIIPMQSVVIRVSREATDLAGSRLKQEFSTYFYPGVITTLATEPLNLWNLDVSEAPATREYRVVIAGPLTLNVTNPGMARVAFETLDGTPVASGDTDQFQLLLPAAGTYVLVLTKGPDGVGWFRVNVTLTPEQ